MLDGLNNCLRGKGRVVIRFLDHRLQLRIVLAKSIDEENSAQVVTIEWANGKDCSMEQVNFLNDVSHRSTRAEASIKCLGDEGDLSVGAEVLVTLAKALENGGSSGKGGDNLVVCL